MNKQNDAKLNSRTTTGRRDFLKTSVAGAVGATLAPTGTSVNPLPATARRPNIIYIHSHDTGRLTSPYGFSVPTPNLKRLTEEGILLRQAYNAAPTCSPSRASLLTGECPHSNGMLGLVNRAFEMTPEGYTHHIVCTLRQEARYHSMLSGHAKHFRTARSLPAALKVWEQQRSPEGLK